MLQWHSCKAQAGDAIVFFRLGDFYEAFYDDAIIIAKELSLTLTKRQEIPMAGVPFHTSEAYIDKLVAKGYKLAVVEQMEDPKAVKGIVKREIVRIVTPGTVVNSSLLSDKKNNFLACVTQVNAIYGLSVLDLTTADFRAMEFENEKALFDELCRLSPKELLLSEKWGKTRPELLSEIKDTLELTINQKQEWYFDHKGCCDTLLTHFAVHHLDGFGLKGMTAAINAAGAILKYIKEDLSLPVDHIHTLAKEHLSHYMHLDRATQKHLELFESLNENKKSHTLLNLLDLTHTPMGGRKMKQWIAHPLLLSEEISQRQNGVEEGIRFFHLTQQMHTHLREIRDLERLMMRIETGHASPRDLVGLRLSLENVQPLPSLLAEFSSPLLSKPKRNSLMSPLSSNSSNRLLSILPLCASLMGDYSKEDLTQPLMSSLP